VLAASPTLAKLAQLAGQHHERLDGSGYHHAARGAALSVEARILAAAEAFQNKIEARPHRAAHSPQAAAELLQKEVRDGRLDAGAVQAVIRAARVKSNRPPGQFNELTTREIEILRALAQGLSMKDVGRALGISPKTVDNHIQNIYPKIGVRTRGGAVLYAVENGLTGA
jgi:HD-GYP domain-containing protein (c-di-GMP phosphodiesterase class II)